MLTDIHEEDDEDVVSAAVKLLTAINVETHRPLMAKLVEMKFPTNIVKFLSVEAVASEAVELIRMAVEFDASAWSCVCKC